MFFISGFIAGYIAKEVCTKTKTPLSSPKQTKNYFMCKITNEKVFDELFPRLPNNSASRVQPQWEFCEHKRIIRIEIKPLKFYERLTFENYIAWNGLDLSLFQEIGECYVYITLNETVIVYRPDSIIDDSDFIKKETELSKKYNNIICAVFDTMYITKYFKMFLQNTVPLTPEVVMNYIWDTNNVKNNSVLKIVTTESKYFIGVHEIV
jgi:hypothetical protein